MQFQSLVGHQICFITACGNPRYKNSCQKLSSIGKTKKSQIYEEPFMYKINSARTKYILLTWAWGVFWGKEASKGPGGTFQPFYL